MRIVAGEFRGRRILSPRGRKIRPTTDRVREAIFSIIADRLPGARVLDLFAGTGALGLEALSRGAAQAVFVDENREAVRLMRQNIALCGAQERARVIQGSVHRAMRVLAAELSGRDVFDLVFMDPPYGKGQVEGALLRVADIVKPTALVIVEHSSKDALPTELERWQKTAERKYGDTKVSIFQRELPGCE